MNHNCIVCGKYSGILTNEVCGDCETAQQTLEHEVFERAVAEYKRIYSKGEASGDLLSRFVVLGEILGKKLTGEIKKEMEK